MFPSGLSPKYARESESFLRINDWGAAILVFRGWGVKSFPPFSPLLPRLPLTPPPPKRKSSGLLGDRAEVAGGDQLTGEARRRNPTLEEVEKQIFPRLLI